MGVRRCLARSLTSLALLRTPKSANGPRSNSFRPDSPFTTNLPKGRKTQPAPLTTPDMVRSGRVLPTSVKSPIYCTVNQMTLVHMVFSREVFSCAFCTKLPSYTTQNCVFLQFPCIAERAIVRSTPDIPY